MAARILVKNPETWPDTAFRVGFAQKQAKRDNDFDLGSLSVAAREHKSSGPTSAFWDHITFGRGQSMNLGIVVPQIRTAAISFLEWLQDHSLRRIAVAPEPCYLETEGVRVGLP